MFESDGGQDASVLNSNLSLQDISKLLHNTPVVLRELLSGIPRRATVWHPAAERWCINEVVGHLLEEDKRDFVGRIRLILQQDKPQLLINDQEEVARTRRDCDKDLEVLLGEFETVRLSSVAFVLQLKEATFDRGGIHPRLGCITVANLLCEWIYHDLNHIRQISSNVQRFLWNDLGNMQQFYQNE